MSSSMEINLLPDPICRGMSPVCQEKTLHLHKSSKNRYVCYPTEPRLATVASPIMAFLWGIRRNYHDALGCYQGSYPVIRVRDAIDIRSPCRALGGPGRSWVNGFGEFGAPQLVILTVNQYPCGCLHVFAVFIVGVFAMWVDCHY